MNYVMDTFNVFLHFVEVGRAVSNHLCTSIKILCLSKPIYYPLNMMDKWIVVLYLHVSKCNYLILDFPFLLQ